MTVDISPVTHQVADIVVLEHLRSYLKDLPYGKTYLAYQEPSTGGWYLYISDSIEVITVLGYPQYQFSDDVIYYAISFYEEDSGYYSIGLPHYSSVPENKTLLLPDTYTIYSELSGFPRLIERSGSFETQAIFVCLVGSGLFYLMSRLRDSLRL